MCISLFLCMYIYMSSFYSDLKSISTPSSTLQIDEWMYPYSSCSIPTSCLENPNEYPMHMHMPTSLNSIYPDAVPPSPSVR